MSKKFHGNYHFSPSKCIIIQNKTLPLRPMNTLSHHIECLLLHHDCVVVPQFGAFITRNNDSLRVESEDLFFPPLRVVRFQPELTEDDGLLVESMRVAMHQSVAETKRTVQRMVLDLRQQLLADGQVDFGSLGLFSQDEDGRVTFEPCQAGVITPAYFGLDAFVMPRLSALQRRSLNMNRQESAVVDDADEEHITIRLNRRSLRYVAATVAAVLIGLLFSSPVTETLNQPQQATVFPDDVPRSIATPAAEPVPVVAETTVQTATGTECEPDCADPAPAAVQPAAPAPVQTAPSKVSSAKVASVKEKPVPQTPEESGYCIVLASDVSVKNARNFVETLQKQGFKHVRILEKGKYRRVVIDHFATYADATRRNAEIHRMGRDFADSWVLKL